MAVETTDPWIRNRLTRIAGATISTDYLDKEERAPVSQRGANANLLRLEFPEEAAHLPNAVFEEVVGPMLKNQTENGETGVLQ